jgi:hypothetical protein
VKGTSSYCPGCLPALAPRAPGPMRNVRIDIAAWAVRDLNRPATQVPRRRQLPEDASIEISGRLTSSGVHGSAHHFFKARTQMRTLQVIFPAGSLRAFLSSAHIAPYGAPARCFSQFALRTG